MRGVRVDKPPQTTKTRAKSQDEPSEIRTNRAFRLAKRVLVRILSTNGNSRAGWCGRGATIAERSGGEGAENSQKTKSPGVLK